MTAPWQASWDRRENRLGCPESNRHSGEKPVRIPCAAVITNITLPQVHQCWSGLLKRVIILGLAALFATASLRAAVLTTARQIRQLTPAQAANGAPVILEGVVTYYDPVEHILFLADRTGSIFILTRRSFSLSAGDRIEVRGKTASSYKVVVSSDDIRILGKSPLPNPTPATFPQLMTGQWDCSYVTISGTVVSATMQDQPGEMYLLLELLMEGGPVNVHIEHPKNLSPQKLLDTRVTLTGVSGGSFDGKFQLVGTNLYLNSPAAMRITAAQRTDPASIPLTRMDRVMGSYNVIERSRRVHVRGSVTLYEPGSQLVVEDAGTAVLVHTHQIDPVNIGDIVDVTGFADADDHLQSLDHGQFSTMGRRSTIRPQPVEWDAADQGKYTFNLVSMDGRLIAEVHETGQDTLFLNSGGHVFSAVLRLGSEADNLPAFPAGSLIRVSGVCFIENGGPWNTAAGFSLHLRNPQDVQVLAHPAWWTVAHLLYLVGALALLILIALAWVELLRRRVHQQTRLIRRGMIEEAERERSRALLEKERSRVLVAINSLLPLDEVLGMICELMRRQVQGLDCWCEIAASGTSAGRAPDAVAVSNQHHRSLAQRDILSRAGERLGSFILAAKNTAEPPALNSEIIDMGVSLAALAIDHRRLYEGLVRRSEYDQLTDVPNRFYLESSIDNVLASARLNHRRFALIYIDLDRFKLVNDRYGHRVGDIYLQHVARRLSEKLRGHDTLARVGGDEFIILVPIVESRAEAAEIADRLAGCFESPFRIDGKTIDGSASIGVAVYPEDGEDEDQLKRFADSAMYASKHQFNWLGAKP